MSKSYKCLLVVLGIFVAVEIGLLAYGALGGSPFLANESSGAGLPQGRDSAATDTILLDEAPMLNDEIRAYLTQQPTWRRNDLERLGLVELYDDMNNYNFEALTGKWASTLLDVGHTDVSNAAATHVDGLAAPFTYSGSIPLADYIAKLQSAHN